MSTHPLRIARQERGWSQAYVAEKLGISQRTVVRWEEGDTLPYPYYREQLAALFGMSIQQLGLVPDNQPEEALAAAPSAVKPAAVARPVTVTMPWLLDPLIPFALGLPGRLQGREDLLAQIKGRLFAGDATLPIALNGLPGIGKTALAATLVQDAEVQAHFQDGILWATPGTQPSILSLLARWGSLLGIKPADVEDVQQESAWGRAIHATIGTRRMLLVIDDAWSAEVAMSLHVGGPRCVHLLTTRLPQVAFAFAEDTTLSVPELSDEQGLALLARYVPDLLRSHPDQMLDLVRAAGGLPLALTLIGRALATQAATGQPRRVQRALQHLHNAQQRLQIEGPVTAMQRPASLPEGSSFSLYASITLSVQQMSEQAKRALQALTIYPARPGSFSEEAALWVIDTPAETLDELWDAGLLESSSMGRYTLHQTIADYARMQLSDEQQAMTRQRLVAGWLPYLREHAQDYVLMDQEWANAQVVVETALSAEDTTGLSQIVSALQPYLRARGLVRLAERYAQVALKQARKQVDQEGQALLLRDLAELMLVRREYNRANDIVEQGLALVQPQHSEVRCDLLRQRGRALRMQGEHEEARLSLEEALSLARQYQDMSRLCSILDDLGTQAKLQGQYEQARTTLEEGLALARYHALYEQICILLEALGIVAWEQGHMQQAQQYMREGLQLAHDQGYRFRESVMIEHSGVIASTLEHFEEAADFYEQALTMYRQMGNRGRISGVLTNLADAANRAGDYIRGASYAQEALDLARELNYQEACAMALANLGWAIGKLGEVERANTIFEEALEVAQALQDAWLAAGVFKEWGEVLLHHAQIQAATARFTDLLEMGRGPEASPLWVGWAQWGLARLAERRGALDEARQLGQESLEIFVVAQEALAEQVRTWLQTLP